MQPKAITHSLALVAINIAMFIACFLPWISYPPFYLVDISVYDIATGTTTKSGIPTRCGMLTSAYIVFPLINVFLVAAYIITHHDIFRLTLFAMSILMLLFFSSVSVTCGAMLMKGPIIYFSGSLAMAIMCYCNISNNHSRGNV